MHPYLFQFGRFVLPTYGVLAAIAIVLSLLVCVHNARLLGLDTDKIWSLALLAIITYVVSSKILLAVLYWRQYGPLSLSMGGTQDLAGVAGTVAAVAAALLGVVHKKLPLLRAADAVAPGLALGAAIFSIACLEAGCDYGTPTSLPWAIVFRRPIHLSGPMAHMAPGPPVGVPLHPAQLYAGFVALAVFAVLFALLHRQHREGEVFGAWLFLAGLGNAVLAPFRGAADPLLGYWVAGLVPLAQILSAGMVLGGAWLWLRRPAAAQVPLHG